MTDCPRRYPASIIALLVLSACGGGSPGDAGIQPAPEALAALPDTDAIVIGNEVAAIAEDQRTLSVAIARTGSGRGAATVRYRSLDGSARAGEDFVRIDGQLSWADGEIGIRYVPVIVYSDLEVEPVERLQLELYGHTGSDAIDIRPSLDIDITNSTCDPVLGGELKTSRRLSAPCYRLTSDLVVSTGGALSLDPGVTVIAAAGTRLLVEDGGSLSAQGTQDYPILFRGSEHVPSHWGGIEWFDSDSSANALFYTHVQYADTAVTANRYSRLDQFGFNRLIDNRQAVNLPASLAWLLDEQSTFHSTSDTAIVLTGSTIDDTVQWSALDEPYTTSGRILVDGRLELTAGVDIRFGVGDFLFISSFGVLRAIGTADRPVRFSGTSDTPGSWDGLQFLGSTNQDNRLEHTLVLHGGGDPARPGNIVIYGAAPAVTVQDSMISDSAGYGIWIDSDDAKITLEGTSFADNAEGDTYPVAWVPNH